MADDLSDLHSFDGTVRLFPLPNVVLFPQVMLPLHVFEPRYRRLTADALAGDRLITMALLRPGWEADYHGRPAVYSAGCAGRLERCEPLEDGRFNILLRGLSRFRVVEEHAGEPYRLATVEVLSDEPGDTSSLEEMRDPFTITHASRISLLFASAHSIPVTPRTENRETPSTFCRTNPSWS